MGTGGREDRNGGAERDREKQMPAGICGDKPPKQEPAWGNYSDFRRGGVRL